MCSLVTVLVACGGGRTIVEHEETAQEPAWAAEYTAGVQAACECQDAPCIRGKRPALDAMVTEHGGLDDAPASVHQGKAKLEVCWKQTARDLALELEDVATTICECKSSYCADEYRQQLATVTERYSAGDPDALRTVPEATDASRAVFGRITKCVGDRTISAADYLARTEALANEMCGCQDDACTKQAIKNRFSAFDEWLFVGTDPELSSKIDAAEQRSCKCMKDALARGVHIEVGPVKGTVSVRMTCS